MGLKPDTWIAQMALEHNMIDPFIAKQIRVRRSANGGEPKHVISYGLSSYGYDMRLSDEFKVFTNVYNAIVDPKEMDDKSYVEMQNDTCIIPPNSFILGRSIEHWRIPTNVTVICLGKSTYARCGISVNITPMEAGWQGFLTIEISNMTPLPVRVYAHEGISQCLFFEGDGPCEVSYADRQGKYQDQVGVQVAKV